MTLEAFNDTRARFVSTELRLDSEFRRDIESPSYA
jgi:hypothetical protein